MSEHSPDPKAERLLALSEEVSRIAKSLAQLSMGAPPPSKRESAATDADEVEISEETLNWLINARNSRTRYLPRALFSEPAWNMLLDLLRAELAQRSMSVPDLCTASSVPESAGLRWLNYLEQQGLVIRRTDAQDARSALVELSLDGSRALRRYVRDVIGGTRAQLCLNLDAIATSRDCNGAPS